MDCGFKEYILEDNIYAICGYVKKGIFMIDPLGDLYLCPLFTGCKEYCVGSINADGDAKWNQIYYDLITRDPCDNSECRVCRFLPICEGDCPQSVYIKSKSFLNKVCGHRKLLIEQIIWSYLERHYPKKFINLK